MKLSDATWRTLHGAYGKPYDPRVALQKLESEGDADEPWSELWENLHHQGDIGEASFAAIPTISDLMARGKPTSWNGFALSATIEACRDRRGNPNLPEWLDQSYREAWQKLFDAALRALADAENDLLVRSAIAVVAIQKGQKSISQIALMGEDERCEMLDAMA